MKKPRKFQKIIDEIKRLSSEQSTLRNQRRTVRFKGESIMPAHDAAMRHSHNRTQLRNLFWAYDALRGREVPKHHPKYNGYMVENFIVKYTPQKTTAVSE